MKKKPHELGESLMGSKEKHKLDEGRHTPSSTSSDDSQGDYQSMDEGPKQTGGLFNRFKNMFRNQTQEETHIGEIKISKKSDKDGNDGGGYTPP